MDRRNDVIVVTPTAAASVLGIAKRDGNASLYSNFLELMGLKERDPSPIRRKEGIGRTLGPSELSSLGLVEAPDCQTLF